MALPQVVIVGGFWATPALASSPVQVTLIDRDNYHLFQPLLYQVATAGFSPSSPQGGRYKLSLVGIGDGP